MRIAVTGTPGTGKTTATDRIVAHRDSAGDDGWGVDATIEVVHLNEVIREEGLSTGTDAERDSLVADLDAVADWLDDHPTAADVTLVESHLAHRLAADRVVVLRCHPDELEGRLAARGEPDATVRENAGTASPSQALARSARENAESEALDVILGEAIARHGRESVYEIDATDRTPEGVTREIAAVAAGERDPSAGTVSFVEYL